MTKGRVVAYASENVRVIGCDLVNDVLSVERHPMLGLAAPVLIAMERAMATTLELSLLWVNALVKRMNAMLAAAPREGALSMTSDIHIQTFNSTE